MERQSQLLLALAAVLLGMLAVIALVEPPEDDAAEEQIAEWSPLLPGLDAAEVTALRLSRGDDLRAFSRDPDGWRIVAPVQAGGDDTRIEALVDSLVTVQVGPDLGGDPADYGLDAPDTTVTVETVDGATHVLELGAAAPVGAHTYLRLAPDGPPRASRSLLGPAVDVPLADLREAALWELPASAVTAVEVTAPDRRIAFSREEGAEEGAGWWVQGEDGPRRRANDEAVAALLADLSGLRAAGFRDDLAPADLVPDWRITVTAAGATQVLEVQAAGAAGGSPVTVLARAPLQPGVVTLAEDWAGRLTAPITAWWQGEEATAP